MAKSASNQYAGFWIRFLAGLIDVILLNIVSGILFGNQCSGAGNFCVGFNGWQVIIPAAYFFGFWLWKSTTIGGLILKLKVVDEKGKAMDAKAAGLRLVGSIVSGVAAGIGFLWVAFDSKKQGWHDKLAKTYVVRGS